MFFLFDRIFTARRQAQNWILTADHFDISLFNQLLDQHLNVSPLHCFQPPVVNIAIVMELENILCLRTMQYLSQFFASDLDRNAADAIQDDQRGTFTMRHLCHIAAGPGTCLPVLTVVATLGHIGRIIVAEMFENDLSPAIIGFGVTDDSIQLHLTMADVFLAVGSGFLDLFRMPRCFANQYAIAFIAEMFQRSCAFQRGQSHLDLDRVHAGDL